MLLHLLQNIELHSIPQTYIKLLINNNLLNLLLSENNRKSYKLNFIFKKSFNNRNITLKHYKSLGTNSRQLIIYYNNGHDCKKYNKIISCVYIFPSYLNKNKVHFTIMKYTNGSCKYPQWRCIKYTTKNCNYLDYFYNDYIYFVKGYDSIVCYDNYKIIKMKHKYLSNPLIFYYKHLYSINKQKHLPYIIDIKNKNLYKNKNYQGT